MKFLNAVSDLAEEEGHHPDIHLTNWRNCRIELTTHAIGGLSMPDLVMAAKIDALPVVYSPKWMRENAVALGLDLEGSGSAQSHKVPKTA